jgi:hypothetical protein
MNMVRPCQEILHIGRRRPLEWADGYLLRIKGGIIGCRLPDELRMYVWVRGTWSPFSVTEH